MSKIEKRMVQVGIQCGCGCKWEYSVGVGGRFYGVVRARLLIVVDEPDRDRPAHRDALI